eukprot:Sspe_Gene.103368::Locus_79181_Transcript_1_1_Confidence_1.000_Length_647::g.103368::m.103368
MDFLNESQGTGSQGGNSPVDGSSGFDFMNPNSQTSADNAGAGSLPAAGSSNSLGSAGGAGSLPAAGSSTSLSSMPEAHPTEFLEKFQRESMERLAQKDAENDKKLEQVRQKAQETLEKMAADRQKKIEGRKESNREDEQQSRKEHDRLFSEGPVWDRVVSLLDLKKGDERQMRKTQRMREIFQYLREQGGK